MAGRRSLSRVRFSALFVVSAHAGSTCPLPWNTLNDSSQFGGGYNSSAVCPYGWSRKPFDVTVPPHPSVLECICIAYGYLVFILIVASIVSTLILACHKRGIPTRNLSFLGFVSFCSGINEFVFKPLVKQARPDRSCNITCGFPSGHSTFAIGFFVLMFCDGLWRVRPKVPFSPDAAQRWMRACKGKDMRYWLDWRFWFYADVRSWNKIIPLSADDTMPANDFACFLACWFLMLVPVPVTRVVLNDHTEFQSLVGSVAGLFEAVIWHAFMRVIVLPRANHRLGDRVGCIFIHNFALPRFDVYSRSLCRMARYEDELSEATESARAALRSSPLRLRSLKHMQKELTWYLDNAPTFPIPGFKPYDKIYQDIENEDFSILLERIVRFEESMQSRSDEDQIELSEALHASYASYEA